MQQKVAKAMLKKHADSAGHFWLDAGQKLPSCPTPRERFAKLCNETSPILVWGPPQLLSCCVGDT